MYRMTRFGELLKGFRGGLVESCVERYQGDKHSKGLSCRSLLLAMIFGQINGSKSLRSLVQGFNQHRHTHYHLNTRAVKRSTLSEAQTKRDARIFRDISEGLIAQAARQVRADMKEMIYLVDSTPIQTLGRGFEWAKEHQDNRISGFKIHVAYHSASDLLTWTRITYPVTSDVVAAREDLPIEPKAIYVFDKGYTDYNWWHRINETGATFVTRFKKNAALLQIQTRKIPKLAKGIVLKDERVRFKNKKNGARRINHYRTVLRRITVAREGKAPLVLATNDLRSSALKIATLYQQRWGIEICFKWIKQNLRVKRFYGQSDNAVRIQLYSAIITYMLIAFYKDRQGLTSTMRECLILLAQTLFTRPKTEDYYQQRREKEQIINDLQCVLPV